MSRVFFTSDTHFGQGYVADLRGYKSVKEHDEDLVRKWNSVVGPRDIVWHLGDVGWGGYKDFQSTLRKLRGTIHLITGNHDEVAPGVNRKAHSKQDLWGDRFMSIQPFHRVKYSGIEMLLSHYPYEGEGGRDLPERHSQYRLRNEGMFLLHGHTHSAVQWKSSKPLEYHVGWDAHADGPVPLEDILDTLSLSRSLNLV